MPFNPIYILLAFVLLYAMALPLIALSATVLARMRKQQQDDWAKESGTVRLELSRRKQRIAVSMAASTPVIFVLVGALGDAGWRWLCALCGTFLTLLWGLDALKMWRNLSEGDCLEVTITGLIFKSEKGASGALLFSELTAEPYVFTNKGSIALVLPTLKIDALGAAFRPTAAQLLLFGSSVMIPDVFDLDYNRLIALIQQRYGACMAGT